MRPLILALGATLAFSPLSALAAPAAAGGANQDARCLMTMAAFTSAKDPNLASDAQFGVAFFAGRIKARNPNYDLGVQLKAVAGAMNGQAIQAEANRCGAMVIAALKELAAAQSSFGPPPAAAKPPAGAPPPKP